MNFPEDVLSYLSTHTLIEIKGGLERESFLEIWMVEVGGRLFSRSWNKSERSWFTEFERTGRGEIKYGNQVIEVKGRKVAAEDEIHEAINEAYLTKYNQPANIPYAQGITQTEYRNYTMEFFH
ncbi:MAG: DUF2255 family protein [Flavobacteriaceae bacterium]|nr:DUF2255 family protein [Flavobacteriaceae bacterium]